MQTKNLAESGNWWLPGKKERQFYGKLIFNQTEGATLTLSDTLNNLYDFPSNNEDFIILGDLTKEGKSEGKEFTKASVWVSIVINRHQKISESENSVKIVFRLKYIFLGAYIEDKNVKFEKITISYSNLDHWISAIHDLNPERLPDRMIYTSPIITVNKKCNIRIASSPTFFKQGSKIIKEDNIQLEIESFGDKSLRNYLILEGIIHDFLNFAIIKGVATQSFEGSINQGTVFIPTKILFHTFITEKMHKLEVKSRSLFLYSEIADRLEFYLNNWFRLYKENKVIMDLYFGVIYNTASYLSNNFLMLFTALEAYHAAFLNKNSSKAKQKASYFWSYNDIIDKSNLSRNDKEEFKKWARQKGRLVAKEKIEEVYGQFHDILPFLSNKIGDKNEFVDKIIRYRNRLTHGSKTLMERKDDDLFWQYKNLQLILQLCILSRLGFDNEKIKQIYYLDKITKTKKSLS